jgi:hypothetical protein
MQGSYLVRSGNAGVPLTRSSVHFMWTGVVTEYTLLQWGSKQLDPYRLPVLQLDPPPPGGTPEAPPHVSYTITASYAPMELASIRRAENRTDRSSSTTVFAARPTIRTSCRLFLCLPGQGREGFTFWVRQRLQLQNVSPGVSHCSPSSK